MKERVLVSLLIRELFAEQAAGIRKNLEGIGWAEEFWTWEHHPEEHWLKAEGKAELDLADMGGELQWLASHVWDVTGEYCDVALMLNPAEPGQRFYVADEREYADYLVVRYELEQLDEEQLREQLQELCSDLEPEDLEAIREVWQTATGKEADW